LAPIIGQSIIGAPLLARIHAVINPLYHCRQSAGDICSTSVTGE